jgi:hypothetical protein
VKDFSLTHWGEAMEGWMANVERLSERRWGIILGLCGGVKGTKKQAVEDDVEFGDISLLEANRTHIYVPSP